MTYDPRTIALQAELFHPPQPLDPRPVQRLHNEMFHGREPAYSSFAVTPAGPVLSNPVLGPEACSQVSFLADRVQFREELGALTVDEFAERVSHVGRRIAEERQLQVFVAEAVVLRALVNPQHVQDSREFVGRSMFGFGEELEVFERPAQLVGLRMVFPPGPDHPDSYSLRVESWVKDPRSLFVEVQGTFGPLITQGDLEDLGRRVHATYGFLTQRALPFLGRFDRSSRG